MDNLDFHAFLVDKLESDTSLTELEKCEVADQVSELETEMAFEASLQSDAEYQAMLDDDDLENDLAYFEYAREMATA
jgi:hypothetical protein